MGVPLEEATVTFEGYPPSNLDAVRDQLVALGVAVKPYRVEAVSFQRYLAEAPYPDSYRRDFGPLFIEKALEHWVSLDLIGSPAPHEVGIDIASCSSPFPDIAAALTGIPTYRQDLSYPDGVHGMQVGGSAARLPLCDGSLGRMTLHCSLEHFEGDADIAFLREAVRVLRPGGAVCILPLYLAEVFHNLTDPEQDRHGLVFDDGAAIAEVRGWNNRFGRVYDAEWFHQRVLANVPHFAVTVFDVENARDLDPICYLRFALLLRRRTP